MGSSKFIGFARMPFAFPSIAFMSRVALTLVLGGAGGFVFQLLGLPAPWLSGSMIAVSVATLSGAPTNLPDPLRNVLFVLLGISMGTGVRPDVIDRIAHWPLSLILLVVLIAAITMATYVFLRWVARWDEHTSFFAAIPGALSYVLILASQSNADLRRVAVSQTTRLFFLVAVLPAFLSNGAVDTGNRFAQGAPLDPGVLALTVLGCILAGWVADRFNVPAGWLTGAFFFSSFLNGTGLIVLTIPDWAVAPGYVGLGAMIGTRFGGADLRLFLGALWASVGAFGVGISVSAVFSAGLSAVTGIPFGQALLAYAPGGLEAMTLLAFMLDLDPAFVATHQLARYIAMVFLLPLAVRFVLGRNWQGRARD